ncbi:MAG TPA: hypothetical protein VH105_00675 [Burkholderiales bacterium]|nr:hypothetical protein [Burkholderiales bacterium]
MKTRSPSLPLASDAAAPALRRPRLTRRQVVQERARQDATRPGRFDPRKYALPARPKREKIAAPAADAGTGVALDADATEAAPALTATLTPARTPPPLRPLVLPRPLVRAGGEDYRQHPSRLTPQQREAYWAAPVQPAAATRQAREE